MVPGEVLVVVTDSTLDVVKDQKRLPLVNFPANIIYAKILRQNEKHTKAITIDSELNLNIIELMEMRQNPHAKVLCKFNLLTDSTFFETFYVKTEGTSSNYWNDLDDHCPPSPVAKGVDAKAWARLKDQPPKARQLL